MKRHSSRQPMRQTQRGSVLVFALLLMAIILMGSLGVMATTIIDQNIAGVSSDSTTAFQAADAGAEQVWAQFRRERIGTLGAFAGASCTAGAVRVTGVGGNAKMSFVATFRDKNGALVTSCSASTKDIRSAHIVGYYRKAVRAVEIAVSVPTDDVTNGLVAHWTFDSDFTDSSGNHDATAHGDAHITTTAPPVGGGAAAFDGSGDYAEVAATGDVDFANTDSYTIALWVRFADISGKQAVLHKQDGFYLRSDDAAWNYQGLKPSVVQFPVEKDTWYHVVLWQDGAADSRAIYINGKRADQAAAIDASANKPVLFGAEDTGLGTLKRYFNGVIDDVRIYNRALSPDEITILCENTFGGNTPVSGVTCGG